MGRLFYDAQELLRLPQLPGVHDRYHLHFHFRPARPANLLVTRDVVSDELNLTGQTFGRLTSRPLTICLHSNRKSSPHATNNLRVGAECVVALPGPDLVRQTWISALPLPRGIFEGDAAGLTLLPSQAVSVPGIAECPVNLECRVERVKQRYSHNAVFLRVVGASIEEAMLAMDRPAAMHCCPLYEVEDQANSFGGAIERLGCNGQLLECPGFPVGPKCGPDADASEWIAELCEAGLISQAKARLICGWVAAWPEVLRRGPSEARHAAHTRLTRALELCAWEQWDGLHAFLAEAGCPC